MSLYNFVWHEFCDWYLEAVKPVLYGKKEKEKLAAKSVLYKVLKDTIILLHPFIPFITEEIWHKLPKNNTISIMNAEYPLSEKFFDNKAVITAELIIKAVTGIRNIRGEMNIAPSLKLDVILHTSDKKIEKILTKNKDIIINLARLNSFYAEKTGKKPDKSAAWISDNMSVYVLLKGIIDFKKEILRLKKELKKTAKEFEIVNNKLNNKNFLQKAKKEVVKKTKNQYNSLCKKQDNLKDQIKKIKLFDL